MEVSFLVLELKCKRDLNFKMIILIVIRVHLLLNCVNKGRSLTKFTIFYFTKEGEVVWRTNKSISINFPLAYI